MSGAGEHSDKGFAKWWIWLAVVFAVAIGIIYIGPFIFSQQPEEQLETAPASITEAEQTADNSSEQHPEAQSGQPTENVSIAEDSPSRGAEEAASPQ